MVSIRSWSCVVFLAVLAAATLAQTGAGAPAGGELVIDSGALPLLAIDPIRYRSTLEKNVFSLAYERLTAYDNSMRLVPGLAEKWQIEPDRLTWTFTLRRGVRFHDGSAFTAQAAKFNLDRMIDPRSLSLNGATYRESIESVTATGETTLQIRTRGPVGGLPQLLAGWGGEMACPEPVRTQGEEFNRKGCGTGPYQVEEFVPRDRVILARFAGYWGQAGASDRIVVRTVPEETARVAALSTGQTHVLMGVPSRQVEFLRRNPRIGITDNRSMYMDYIAFNLSARPFDDWKVRVAIAHAIDVSDIVQKVYNGNILPFGGPVQPSLQGYDPTVRPYARDLNKARQLLREAGHEGLRMTFTYYDAPVFVALAEVLQAQLREAGVDLTLRRFDFAAYAPTLARGDQHLFTWGWGNSTGDPFFTMNSIFRSTAPIFVNVARYRNPAVDDVLNQTRGELDPARRARLISRASRMIAADASHILFLSPKNSIAHLAEVTGVEPYPVGDYTMFLKTRRRPR
jgi:peptide/nickel transport system substrate-binding protein